MKQKRKQKRRPAPVIEALEPRILYSADVFGGALDGPAAEDPLTALLDETAAMLEKQATHPQNQLTDSPDPEAAAADQGEDTTPVPTATPARQELILIDSATPDYARLVEDLLAQADDSRQLEVVMLDANRDGIAQISDILDGRSGLDAIHLISHANDGAVSLGSSRLESATLRANAREVQAWGNAFGENGDFLIYGCNLAASAEGQTLVDTLGRLTGADVAASNDLTGHESQGGDWELEYRVGTIDTAGALGTVAQQTWVGTLQVETFEGGVGGYLGTVDTYVNQGSPAQGYGPVIEIMTDGGGGNQNKFALIRFDGIFGSGPTQIPLGSTINSASLDVYVNQTVTASNVNLHSMLIDWGSSPSWNSLGTGVQIDDSEAKATADSSIDSNLSGWQTFAALESALQAWSDGTVNYGWVMDLGKNGEWRASSSEGAFQPKLTVDFTPVGDAPTISNLNGDSLAYSEGDGALIIEQGGDAVVTDTDSTDFDTGNLTVSIIAGGDPTEDLLAIRNQGVVPGEIGVVGADVTYGGTVIGTWSGGSGGTDLVVTFDADATPTAVTALVNNITYENTDTVHPTTGARTVSFTVNDGDGRTSLTHDAAVIVSDSNDAPVLHTWYNDSWDYRKAITIDAAQVQADLTNFPVLINFNADSELVAYAQSHGDDILFTAADGMTKLTHEIESYDPVTGQLTAWVKTDLSSSTDTTLFLYYGNAAAANQQDAENVWDANYMGVWHLNDTPTGVAGDINDSTSNNNDGTTEGAMDAADSVNARIGTGLDFDEVDDLIRMQDSPTLDSVADEATFELWVWYENAADGDTQILMSSSNRYGGWDGYEWASLANGDHFFYPDAMLPDTNYNLGPNPFTNQQWHHLAATMDFATKEVNVFVDGAEMTFATEGVPGSWSTLTSSDDWLWGGNPERAARFFDGMMDEIRVSDVVRSQEWIQTSMNNQSDPSIFFSLGSAEGRDLTLTAIDEDDTDPTGDTVAAILGSGAGDRITDADSGALEGIAVVGVDNSNGQWQYDATGGGTWVAFGAVSDISAVLLDTGGKVRFVPNADYNGPAGDLTFRAWDQTSGTNGQTAIDVSSNGGMTAYSTETYTTSSIVNPVNDAPTLNDDSYAVNEDAALSVDWWDSDWIRRQELTLDNLAQSETLTDFPVLIVLNSSSIDYGQTKDDGSDLRFFAADGTPLAYEIEQWNEGGDSSVWVRVPQITGSSNSDSIWMYYGNATVDSVNAITGVWDSDFVGVWHLNEEQAGAGNSGVYKDATGQAHDGIDRITATGREGQVTDGQEFGANDWVEIGHEPSLDLKDSMTISFWIKPSSDSGTFNRVVEKGLWGYNNSYYFGGGNGTNDLTFYLNGQEVIDTADGVLTVGAWQHATLSYTSNGDGTGTARLYLNGAEIATGNYTNGNVPGNTGRLAIGHSDPSYDFDGFIDEVQISKTDRSADWIAAQYQATKNQFGSEFVQFSVVEVAPAVDGVVTNDTDVDLEPLVASVVTGPSHAAAFTFSKDGTFSYTPNADFHGSDTFTYKVTDGTVDSNVQTVTITVNPVNDIPTNGPLTLAAIAEDSGPRLVTQAELVANANDVDGDSLTATGLAISAGSGTLFDNGDGTWNYAPAADDDTAVSFSYSITDGTDTVAGSASMDITSVNDLPTTSPVTLAAIAEDSGARLITQAELLSNASDTEGDSLTASGLAISAGSGSLVDNGDGTWNYTPALNDDTSVAFSYSVTDGADTVTGSATLDITPVNDAPTTTPVILTAIAEDSGVRLITQAELLSNASDTEGDSLTATGLAISAGSGTLVDNGNGTWNYTPAADDDTAVTFTYSITDGIDTVAGSASMDITPVNDAPTTSPVTLTAIAEDSGVRLITQAELLSNASDTEGDSLTATGLTISAGSGTLADNGDGTWNYTPALNDDTAVSFSYSITDGMDTVVGSATLDITPANDAPTTSPVTLAAIAEDGGVRLITQAELLANASDVEGDSLTATGLSIGASAGSLVDNGDGTWNYTPALNDDTAVSFSYSITDGTGTAAGSATLDITPVNDAPTTSPVILATIAEDSGVRLITQAELLANASDTEGDSLTATGLTISAGAGTLVDNGDGTWNYTPALNDDAAVSFSYNITDGTDTAASSATLDVTPVNDAPTTTPVTLIAIAEDSGVRLITQAELLANASDIEGDSLSAAGLTISAGAGTLVNNGDGTWNYTPALNDDTSVSFSYSITDGTDTAAGSATLDITPVNDAPTTSPVILTAIAEDSGVRPITQAELLGNASDTEGDSLTATGLAISAGSGTLADNGDGTWNYTSALNDDTAVSFSYSIADGTDTVAGSATLDITPVNDAPTTSPVTLTAIAEDSGVRLITQAELLSNASDTEGDSLTATDLTISAGAGTLVDNGDGTWNYTPALNDDTAVSLSYSITDGTDTVAGSATLDITPVNDPPTTTPVTLAEIAEDSGVRLITQAELLANASDTEGDSLTATGLAISTGSGTLADNGDGTWNYTPALNDDTSVAFSYSVTDGTDTVAGSATLDITPVNDAPTTTPVILTAIAEDSGVRLITQAELLGNASDTEGDSLTATGLTISAGSGTLVDNGNGTWNYTPAADDDTAVTFTYGITDGTDTVAGSASMDITPVNDAPTTSPVTLTTIAEDSGVRLVTQAELLSNASDVEGNGLAATGLTISAGSGSLVDNGDGTWNYTPALNDDTSVAFSYSVTDGADTVTGSATLDITPVNDAPTTSPVILTAIAEDSGVRLITQAELLGNASDTEGDSLTATGLTISAGSGTLVDNGNGTWNYTPAADDDSAVTFTYSITDGTDTVAGSASMDITPVNDAPTISPVTLTTIAEDSGVRLVTQAELLSNASDVEGDGLAATGLTISAGSGSLVDNGDGTWNYTPALNDDTAVAFSYSITDGTDTVAGSASMNITPVNDAPTTSPVTLTTIAEDSGVRLITQAELLANASDTEGDSLTATGLAISAGSGTLVDNGDGTWNYTPAADDDTAVSFSYSITDGADTVAGSATLDITPVNDAPTTSPVSLTAIAEDSGVRLITQAELLANASDTEGDSLTATGLVISAGSSTLIDNGNSTWNYTPALNDDTAVSFSYSITDGTDTAAGSATLDITPINDAPTTSPVILTTIAEDSGVRLITQAELLANTSDTEGDSLTATGLAISAGFGTLIDNGDDTWNYTPALNDDTSVAFSYSVTDGTDTVAGSATLDITPLNDPPTTSPVTLAAIAEDSGVRVITQAELLANAADAEGDSLTATGLTISAGSGTLVDNLDGTWNFTPALNDDTSVSFSYSITDGTDTVAGSATLDITPVNDVPTTWPVTLTAIAEDGGVRLITQAELFANAGDVEGDSLTATGLSVSAGSGTLVDNGDGTWNYTPALNDDTAVTFSYSITDGTDTVAGSASMDITSVNDLPTTSPVTLAAIAEDSGARLITQAELLSNASDTEGDSLTASGLAISAGSGTLVDNLDGTWNYTPAGDDDTAVSFSYSITDGTSPVAGSATLNITPVNDAPSTSPVTLVAIAEDSGVRLITQAELLANASDTEGDSLTATGLTISAGSGTLADNGDGTWNYTPALNDDTSVAFSYSVTDGTDTVAGSATLDITPVNDAPTTTPVILTAIAEDSGVRLITQAELLGNASDTEGDSLTATGLTISAGSGTLVDNGNGTWNYTPAADDDTAVTFTYGITDGTDTVAGSASMDITPVNDAPTTSPVTLTTIAEDSGVRLVTQAELLSNASDVEGNGLAATGLTISAGSGSLVDNGDGTWNYTPALNDDTSVAFSYSVTDGADTVTGSATLDITPVNDAPTTTPVIPTAIAEDSGVRLITQAELLSNASDTEGDSLTATGLAISAGSGTLVDNGNGTWNYTPAADDDTAVTFTYSITDGTDTVAGSASMDITPVNDAPTTSPVTLTTIAEDSGVRLVTQAELLSNASDTEGDSLTATGLAISAGSGTLIDNGDGTWNYTPALNDDTSVSFSYSVTDGTDTVAGSAALDITPANDAPTTSPVTLTAIAEDSGVRLITQAELLSNASDTEGDSLTATGLAISTGSGTLIDNGDGTWNYTPALNDDTAVSFSYSITDGSDTVTGSASMDITPVNDPPTTAPVTLAAIAEDSGVRLITQGQLLGNASDTEGDSLTATGLAISAGSGTLVDNGDGTWNYTPAVDDDTSVSFSYSITDGTDTVAGSAALDITPANDAPTTSPVTLAAIAEDSGVGLITQAELLANASDTEGDSLTATALAISTGSGTLIDNGDGTWNYTPALNDDTAVSFSYSITDGADTVAGSATLDITPVNDAPTTSPVTLTAIAEDSGVRLITQAELLSNASDTEGDSLTATGLAISAGSGTVIDNGDGTWNYTPALNDDTAVSFSYSITDGTDTAAGSATLDITPVNDAPTTSPVILTAIAEDSGVRLITQAELLGNASDTEGDSLTATGLTISAGSGTLVDNGNGTWNYTPAADDDSAVTFTYSITDGTDTVAGSASMDITPVNDAPTISPVTLTTIAEDSGVRLVTQAELLSNASDVEGDGLAATGLTISAGSGTLVDNLDGTWNYTPAGDDDTAVSFSYSITDGTSPVAGSATLNITPVNDPPNTSPVTLVAIAEDSGVRLITQAELLANASDTEGDSLTATGLAISTGSGTLADNGDGTWNYTPALNDDAALSFSYGITDGTDTVVASASMDIRPVDDAPKISGTLTGAVAEDGMLIANGLLSISDIDIDDNPIDFPDKASALGDNGYGDFVLTGGTWTYTLNNGHASVQALEVGQRLTDTHTFTASDGSTEVVTIIVNGAEEAPVPASEAAETPADLQSPAGGERDGRTLSAAMLGGSARSMAAMLKGPIDLASESAVPTDPRAQETEAGEVLEEPIEEQESIRSEAESATPLFAMDEDASGGGGGLPRPIDGEALARVLMDVRQDSDRSAPRLPSRPPIAASIDLQHLEIAPFEQESLGLVGGNSVLDNESFVASLEALGQDLEEAIEQQESRSHVESEAVVGLTLSLSAGFVSWVLRAGSLFASFMSMVPLWRGFDPLPILGAAAVKRRIARKEQENADEADESSTVETIFDQQKSG